MKIIHYITISLAIFIIFIMLFGSYLAPHDPNLVNLSLKFAPISKEHFLGCDHLGRDQFSRLIAGSSLSLKSAFITLFFILALGIIIGGLSGFIGGKIDNLLMRICDMFLSFPTVVLALFLVGILGTGLTNVIIAIALTHWAWYARIIRSLVLSLKSKEYVLISKISGASITQNFSKNMIKPIISQCFVLATLDIGHIMLHISGLSFLGLGVKAPTPEWGIMISDAKEYIFSHSELILYPGLALFITVFVFNMLGDMLRDKLDVSVEIHEKP
ncbi:nickel ABC transporter permease subunit NikC [Campylobacter sputorum]|uniref:nickel ABC transporter permease subunit NikC n=1 Tax=Campylobacter sputorum TaxID=206 RepID=UPI00053BF50A|nr:nickel ABC transporter permease subunit NikC [Campylobacter sputorum]